MPGWLKVAIGGLTGGLVIVGGTVLAAMLVDVVDGTMTDWRALVPILRVMYVLAAAVCACVYWMHSPKGREVWTDEQREALKAIKKGEL